MFNYWSSIFWRLTKVNIIDTIYLLTEPIICGFSQHYVNGQNPSKTLAQNDGRLVLVNWIRGDFPILQKRINGRYISYLDNACTTLTPKPVIEKMDEYYMDYPACGGRSAHKLAARVSIECDTTREKIAKLLNARSAKEIVFTKNTTESINIVAKGYPLRKGDIVITTDKEHNSNIVPWHQAVETRSITHSIVYIGQDDNTTIENFKKAISRKVKLVSIHHVSNIDGTTLPVKDIIEISHDFGAKVLLDAAQSVPHMPVDVGDIDPDFVAFSIHKMCGPGGVGVLYGKPDALKWLKPLSPGGGSVAGTTYKSTGFLEPPMKFEGGIQNYVGIIGAGVAVDYVRRVGLDNIREHEARLNRRLTERLKSNPYVRIIGPSEPARRSGIYSFIVHGMMPHDVAMILDETRNIMVRSGTLCAHSWFRAKKINGCVRASMYFYNTPDEIDRFAAELSGITRDFCR